MKSTQNKKGARSWSALNWETGEASGIGVLVPEETPVKLVVDGQLLAVLHCTPEHLDELAAGFLMGQGMVAAYEDIAGIDADDMGASVSVRLHKPLNEKSLGKGRRTVIYSGCGQAPLPAPGSGRIPISPSGKPLAFDPATIRGALANILKRGEIYRRTRGIHSAAICSRQGKVMSLREDIGRHNALDKVLGWTARRSIDPGRVFVAATGRISSEAVAKLTNFGIPLIVTRGVPTSLALVMAHEAGMTLAGSLGPGRLRIYTHPDRLL